VLVERVLHLDAVDVLAAPDQHVLGAVEDEAEPLLVDPRQVTGAHPAIDEGRSARLVAQSGVRGRFRRERQDTQGAEYRAVVQGLKHLKTPPQVIPLPIGVEPVTQFLKNWQRLPSFAKARSSGIVVMGLCGSLTPKLRVGDRVFYQSCQNASGTIWDCDQALTERIQQSLQEGNSLVRAFTSDRILSSAHEKRQLGQLHQADVVDMEGTAILTTL